MQEKKILQKLLWERERERERGREGGRNNISVMENYVKNGRENNKFIKDGMNVKRQNKGRWMER